MSDISTTHYQPAKYLNERIPRYTSYPTAPHFSAAIGGGQYAGWLQRLPEDASLSLYLHVPFCRSLCWYCGCTTTITRHTEPVDNYIGLLKREIGMVADLVSGRQVAHLHWGGGTPTIIGPDTFSDVMTLLRTHFRFAANAEIAVEIDPRRLDIATAQALGAAGITRASLGVQTFNEAAQRAVGRVQSLAVTQTCVDRLRNAGIEAINVDLLYGLPHETVETCQASVQAALTLGPARFSVFGYAHVPQVAKHQRVIAVETLPDAAERLRQEQAIGEALLQAGYVRIGLDHYALPDDPMAQALQTGTLRRNFQGYTDDPAAALIGFGASAISRLPDGYAQNTADLRGWGQKIAAGTFATARGIAMEPDDTLRAAIIERLMCDLRVDVPDTLRSLGFPPDWLDREMVELGPLAEDGLLEVRNGVITVPESARNLVRRVASTFDAYLDHSAGRHAVAV
ncbi:MAG TPA: oxygen-independent coproporphyrinogen III oxidase [Rhodopila sp.]|nr:oxygen-independent coproporphyrinogen III oxidase [Rhodopila sp.]